MTVKAPAVDVRLAGEFWCCTKGGVGYLRCANNCRKQLRRFQMNTIGSIIRFIALSFFALFLIGCDLDTIEEVKSDPYRYENKTARIGGRVTQQMSVLNYGIYELEDATGKIFVISQRGVPSRGARVEVKGNTVNAFSLAGIDYGTVLMEEDRKIHR